MAYNYYGQKFASGYNPNYFPQGYVPVVQPQAVPTVQPPTVQNPQNYPQTQNGIIWISGEKDAAMYPVAPNNAVTLWSQSEPVVYLKQADATGKPTMKTYDLVERTENGSVVSPVQDDKSQVYATKDELGKIATVVQGFSDAIKGLKSDVDTMRGDLYGVAGRKKSMKKVEAVEDDT